MKRYKIHATSKGLVYTEEHPEGEWVMYKDVLLDTELTQRDFERDEKGELKP